MLQKFYRKPEARELSGFGYTEFHQAQHDGRFPEPDGYLGRVPRFGRQKLLRSGSAKRLLPASP